MDGCVSDTLRRTINLTGQPVTSTMINETICEGESYTLPWGIDVTSSGTYRDTLRYNTGCDSLRQTVNLTVQTKSTQTLSPIICEGENYTLPWGTIVNAAGIYRDTLEYTTGCDSLIRIINLTVHTPSSETLNASICSGQTYTLPWGAIVNATGVYRDTLHYTSGCDSLRRTVNLNVQELSVETLNPVICTGANYTLPWGTVVNASGVYRDTLRYVSGCDSVRRTVNLSVQNYSETNTSITICSGQTYALPWGAIANATGVYRDTLRYASGCDSLRRTVNLVVQPLTVLSFTPEICSGMNYTLPWGVTVTAAGTYSDTSRYATGCDSIIRHVNLRVTSPAPLSTTASICSDQVYTLPWGLVTNTPGLYQDTVRSVSGCDSIVRIIQLIVNAAPLVSVSKSNDIDCMIGISRLTASGGSKYLWAPAGSLNNANIANPVAAPSGDTWYRVSVTTDQGCVKQDSVEVKVITGNTINAYPVPNAFTPNNDGKNDCFGFQNWGFMNDYKLTIFNRWGQVVFRSNNPFDCWDGKMKGIEQPAGIYIFQASGKGLCGPVSRNGTLALIR
jgi:gliding motility-associated-like protein